MPFAVTWRDLEIIILSQSKINICHLYVESKRYNKQVDIIKKETDPQRTDQSLPVGPGNWGQDRHRGLRRTNY